MSSGLGELVAQTRTAQRLTQDALATAVGTNRTAIALFEQGRRPLNGDVLERVCRYLSIAEAFWLHHVVRRIPHGIVGVRAHSATYYTRRGAAAAAGQAAKGRTELVIHLKRGEKVPWAHGRDAAGVFAEWLRSYHSRLLAHRVLVPVPRSTISSAVPDAAWPGLCLARALAEVGSDLRVERLISRHTTIRSATSSTSSPRPTVMEQLATLRLESTDLPLGIVLVDDVMTRGTQLVACAKLLVDAGWPGEVDAIAAAYTPLSTESSADELILQYTWDRRSSYPEHQLIGRGAMTP